MTPRERSELFGAFCGRLLPQIGIGVPLAPWGRQWGRLDWVRRDDHGEADRHALRIADAAMRFRCAELPIATIPNHVDALDRIERITGERPEAPADCTCERSGDLERRMWGPR